MADRAERRCAWCGRRFAVAPGPGRPRRFCRRSCRQRDYEARHRAQELGLSEAELIVTREELHRLFDQLWVLECAVADVERDLILETLKHCLGNRTHAANILGISIRTLRNKLNEYAGDGMAVPPPHGGEMRFAG